MPKLAALFIWALTACAVDSRPIIEIVRDSNSFTVGSEYNFVGYVVTEGGFRLYPRDPRSNNIINQPCLSGVFGAEALNQTFRRTPNFSLVRVRGILAKYDFSQAIIIGANEYLRTHGYPSYFENHCGQEDMIIALSVELIAE